VGVADELDGDFAVQLPIDRFADNPQAPLLVEVNLAVLRRHRQSGGQIGTNRLQWDGLGRQRSIDQKKRMDGDDINLGK
jgi:hypothetical protein